MRAPGKSTKVSTLVGRALPSSLKCRVDEKRRKAFFKVSVNSIWNISAPMFSWSSVQEMSSTFHWAQRCPPGWRRSSGRRFSSKRHQGLPARKFATKFANSQVCKEPSLHRAKFASRHNLRPPQEITTDPPGQDKSGRNARTTSWEGRCSSGRIHLATSAKILLFSQR